MSSALVPFDFDFDLTDFEIDESIDSHSTAYSQSPPRRRKRDNADVDRGKRNKREENQLPGFSQRLPAGNEDITPMMIRFLFSPPPNKPDVITSFPYHFARCLNSGDFPSLSNLVNKHLDSTCDISLSYSPTKLNNRNIVQLFELLNDTHPDRIMTVHKQEVFGRRIAADIYMKFTDCKPLYESVARMCKDPTFADYFPPSRADILKRRMRTASRPEAERRKLEALLESDCDIVVYGCVQVVLTLDEGTNKAIGLQMLCDFNSAHIANHNCF